jgi:hypothetical protein
MTSPRPRAALLTLTLLPLASGGAGCSMVFVDGPPPDHASLPYFDCTSKRFAPAADVVLASALGLAAVGATSDSTVNVGDVAATSVLAAAALTSAVYGYVKVDRCRQAKAQLAERTMLQPPPALRPAAIADAAPPAAPPGFDPWLVAGAPPPGALPPPPPSAPPSAAPPPVPGAAPPPAPGTPGGAAQ